VEFLIGYALFALTTALTSAILLMRPVLKDLEREEPLNTMIEYKFITYLTFGVISILVAPIMFLACIVPDKNNTFRDTLAKSLRD
jgi:hypothetical protein